MAAGRRGHRRRPEPRLYGRAGLAPGQRRRVEPDWAELARELKRPGVTMTILWEEYREVHPDGCGHSRFCDLLRGFERRLTPVMRQHHVAGEKAFVDYTGKRIGIADPTTGEIREAEIFAGVLGASNPPSAAICSPPGRAASARAGWRARSATRHAGKTSPFSTPASQAQGLAMKRPACRTPAPVRSPARAGRPWITAGCATALWRARAARRYPPPPQPPATVPIRPGKTSSIRRRPARHSNRKPAIDSDLKPAGVPI